VSELAAELPLLALPDVVMFPGTGMQLEVKNAEMGERLASTPDALIAVFALKGAPTEELSAADVHPIGALARVVKIAKQTSATVVLLRCVGRAELESLTTTRPFLLGRVHEAREIDSADDELGALFLALRQSVQTAMRLLQTPPEFAAYVDSLDKPGALADLVASRMEATTAERAELLATLDIKARVRAVLGRVARRIEVLKMRDDINAQVQGEIGKTQREHMLRQRKTAATRTTTSRRSRSASRRQASRGKQARSRRLSSGACARCRVARPSSESCAPTSSGSSTCPGKRPPRTHPTSRVSATCSTPTTTVSRK
jgi:ATP-dependent Lon protease